MLKRIVLFVPLANWGVLAVAAPPAGSLQDRPSIEDNGYAQLAPIRVDVGRPTSLTEGEILPVQSGGKAQTLSVPPSELMKRPDERDTPDMVPFEPSDLRNPEDWKRKFFDVVIVVNKSSKGLKKQTLDLYQNGELAYSAPISTGREKFEKGSEDRTNKHAPTQSYFTSTPTGYFTPYYLNIDHVSNQWKDAFMPYAVFFNRGIALHQAPVGTEGQLGQRASGGCVRVHPRLSADVFWRVRNSGGPFTETEGRKSSFASQAHYYSPYYGWPFEATPKIPVFSRRGVLLLDKKGKLTFQKGFRTLVIVEDREILPGAPLPLPNPQRLRRTLESRMKAGQYVPTEDWARLLAVENPVKKKTEVVAATRIQAIQPPAEMRPIPVSRASTPAPQQSRKSTPFERLFGFR